MNLSFGSTRKFPKNAIGLELLTKEDGRENGFLMGEGRKCMEKHSRERERVRERERILVEKNAGRDPK